MISDKELIHIVAFFYSIRYNNKIIHKTIYSFYGSEIATLRVNIVFIRMRDEMFGYIRPDKMELRLRDIHRYQDLYCGLCYSIRKNYGQLYGLSLSYDITFLLAVLDGLEEEPEMKLYDFRCPVNPLKHKKILISKHALQYSAFINYFLMYLKVDDDVFDTDSSMKKILRFLLERNKKYRKQLYEYYKIVEKLKLQMKKFNEAEIERQSFDELTNSFGTFFAEIFIDFFSEVKNVEANSNLYRLCFLLGKWVYIIDAYDDFQKDSEKGEFNLLKVMQMSPHSHSQYAIHQRMYWIISYLINQMTLESKRIQFMKNHDLIENFILYGCRAQYTRVLKKNYPEYAKLLERRNSSVE